MFYNQELLYYRKGPLAIFWLAGHTGSKKLTRKEIMNANLPKACQRVLEPEEPMALRMSASLLLGVTRLYGQQWQILQVDVQNCTQSIKRAFSELYNAQIAGAAASLDMPVARASRAAITHATPEPDEHAFMLGLDDYAWGPLFERGASIDVVNNAEIGIEAVEMQADELLPGRDGDDADYGSPSQRKKKGRRSRAFTPSQSLRPPSLRPQNVVADDRDINLPELDVDEPLHDYGQAYDFAADFGFGGEFTGHGDFDLGLGDLDLGAPIGFGNGSLDNQVNASFEQDFQDYGDGGYEQDVDYNIPFAASSSDQAGGDRSRTGSMQGAAGAAAARARSATPMPGVEAAPTSASRKRAGSAGTDADDRAAPAQKRRKRAVKPTKLAVDKVVTLGDDSHHADRDAYTGRMRRANAEAAARVGERDGIEAAKQAIFGVPVGMVAVELQDMWRAVVAVKPELGKTKAVKGAQNNSQRRQVDDGPLSPQLDAELGRSKAQELDDPHAQDFWDPDEPAGSGSFGSAEQGRGYAGGYEQDVSYDIPGGVPSDILSEIGRGGSKAGRLSSVAMPWDAFALERESDVGDKYGRRSSSIEMPSYRPGTPLASSRRGRSSSQAGSVSPGLRRMSDVDPRYEGEIQLDFGDADEGVHPAGMTESQLTLATLQREANNFYDYAKRQAINGELLFSDIVPISTTAANVAAAAFYHVLTLASKNLMLVLGQDEPYGEIRIGFNDV